MTLAPAAEHKDTRFHGLAPMCSCGYLGTAAKCEVKALQQEVKALHIENARLRRRLGTLQERAKAALALQEYFWTAGVRRVSDTHEGLVAAYRQLPQLDPYGVWRGYDLLRDCGIVVLNSPNGRKGFTVTSYEPPESLVRLTQEDLDV